ncbi:hypothetical protein SUDANB15_05125 [Streptomyces sp. enrichment culture]
MDGGSAGQGWEKCSVLGKESARTRRRTKRTDHRRSPPSDNHWSRLTRITHNPAGQASPSGRRPPCPRAGDTAAGSARWGPRGPAGPTGCRGAGNGPSVADRGAFSSPAQGGSLLASNGRITTGRPTDPGRRRWVSRKGWTKLLILGRNPADQRLRLTGSNSGRDDQDLVKRGRIDLDGPALHSGPTGPDTRQNGQIRTSSPGPVRTGPAPAPGARRSPAGPRRRPPRTASATAPARSPGRRPRSVPPSR